MKTNMLTKMLAALLILAYSGCSDDDAAPVDKTQLKKLAKTWTVTSVQLDGTDNSEYYDGLSLTISGTDPDLFTYEISGRPHYSPWPESGSFTFGDPVKTQLIRDGDSEEEILVEYAVTKSTLTLTFTFTGDPYDARSSSVVGQWTFVFGL